MNSLRRRVLALALASALFLGPVASASALDDFTDWEGTWFQLKLKQKGVSTEDGGWEKDKDKTKLYLLLDTYQASTPEGPVFECVFVIKDAGVYFGLPADLRLMSAFGNFEDFVLWGVLDVDGDIDMGDGTRIGFAAQVRGKEKSNGALKSASFKSLGGFTVEQDPGESFALGFSLKGERVREKELPFDYPLPEE
jgi:hypothetical protein